MRRSRGVVTAMEAGSVVDVPGKKGGEDPVAGLADDVVDPGAAREPGRDADEVEVRKHVFPSHHRRVGGEGVPAGPEERGGGGVEGVEGEYCSGRRGAEGGGQGARGPDRRQQRMRGRGSAGSAGEGGGEGEAGGGGRCETDEIETLCLSGAAGQPTSTNPSSYTTRT